jgi:4-hydroxy-tetrahydrodipicolinate reductase
VFGLVAASLCDRVDRILVHESVDSSGYPSAETMGDVGFGHPVDEPGLADRARAGSLVFADAVAMMADALGVDLDDIRYEVEFARATSDIDLGWMQIPEGCVAALQGSWIGVADGKPVLELRVTWKMGEHPMEPDWRLQHGYFVEVDGTPAVRARLQIFPPDDWDEDSFYGLGMIMTAMPAVNAIPHVCAAPPGIVRGTELPVVSARFSGSK